MTIHDGFLLGVGLSLGFVVVRAPFAIVIALLESWLSRLRERTVVLHHRLAQIKRTKDALDRMIGKEPEK